MKKIIIALLLCASSIFSEEKPEKFQELFYVTMGSELPLTKNSRYSRYQRSLSSIGMGTRTFIFKEHGIDTCASMYIYPHARVMEMSVAYLYKPEDFYGIYVGASGYARSILTAWLCKYNLLGYKGFLGYQLPMRNNKSSFLEVAISERKNLSVRSGLMF